MDSFAKFLQEKLNEKAEKTRREEIERQQWNKNINDTYYLIDSWLSDYKAFGLKTEIDTENRHMTIDFLDKKATLQAVDRLMHSQLMISDAECLMEIEIQCNEEKSPLNSLIIRKVIDLFGDESLRLESTQHRMGTPAFNKGCFLDLLKSSFANAE